VFISRTSELSDYPLCGSYVQAVNDRISAAGHVVVDMTGFPASGRPSADECIDRVQGCDVLVGLLGTRHGCPVRDRPVVSYTELEFNTATAAGASASFLSFFGSFSTAWSEFFVSTK
jgi:hypothetical protein